MDIFFYIIIFSMGITFGSFFTLAVYRIPKGEDITHTHSYCPKCNHKLGILDLIPVFSYILLDKEHKMINKPLLVYGIIISIMYIVYLYIIEKTSIYRYVIYLVLFVLILIIDRINSKQKNKNNYTYSLLMIILIMAIFTGEYITIISIIMTVLVILIDIIIKRLKQSENIVNDKKYDEKISITFYLSVFNVICFIILLAVMRSL